MFLWDEKIDLSKDINHQKIANYAVVIGSIFTGISAVLIYIQITSTNEWNRRKASQEMLSNLTTGNFIQLLKNIRDLNKTKTKTEIQDRQYNYNLLLGCLSESEKIETDSKIVEVLNILETISISIKNHIIDEDITYNMLYTFFIDFYYWSLPYIQRRRELEKNEFIFIEYQSFVKRWEKRLLEDKKGGIKDKHKIVKAKNKL